MSFRLDTKVIDSELDAQEPLIAEGSYKLQVEKAGFYVGEIRCVCHPWFGRQIVIVLSMPPGSERQVQDTVEKAQLLLTAESEP